MAEVCAGKVGAVAARAVSRFARNSRDWQQLIEMCRVVDTVLIDQETVYAPRHGNDRLLLGLKGSLNEYELDLLRQRSLSAPLSATVYAIGVFICDLAIVDRDGPGEHADVRQQHGELGEYEIPLKGRSSIFGIFWNGRYPDF